MPKPTRPYIHLQLHRFQLYSLLLDYSIMNYWRIFCITLFLFISKVVSFEANLFLTFIIYRIYLNLDKSDIYFVQLPQLFSMVFICPIQFFSCNRMCLLYLKNSIV